MRPLRTRSAFTLVELLVVMGIIALLMGLMLPAFSNIGKSTSLNAAGNQLVNLLNLARANAMGRNVMTAVVLVNQDDVPGTSHRAVVVMELAPKQDGSQPASADWKQLSRVEELSPGIVVDPDTAFSPADSTTLPAALPTIKFRGKDIDIDSYPRIVFLPNGSLFGGVTRTAKLMQGYVENQTFKQTAPTNNYYQVNVLAASGRTKIERP